MRKTRPDTKPRKAGKISKNMILAETVMNFPETVPVFQKHGLHCIGCAVAAYESIEAGALAHGIDPDSLVRDLNAAVQKPKSKQSHGR